MRWIVAALILITPAFAAAEECTGAPRVGTDDHGNFRFLRAIAERSPAFAMLRAQTQPVTCSYEYGPMTSTITYTSADVRLKIERQFGGCVELRLVELSAPAIPEAEALDLTRREIQFYGPGYERGLDPKVLIRSTLADGSVTISSHDLLKYMGADLVGSKSGFRRFKYFVSIGCED